MPNLTAKFSNGHDDVYKGKRPVKAAWMVITADGTTVSGHSLDRETAAKTARAKAGEMSGTSVWWRQGRGRSLTAGQLAYVGAEARKAGHKDIAAYEAALAKRRADFVAGCTIEVVDL